MGDKGKKDKDKGQKQHAAKDKQAEKRELERQPKRTAQLHRLRARAALVGARDVSERTRYDLVPCAASSCRQPAPAGKGLLTLCPT